jgi:hypothetical protein
MGSPVIQGVLLFHRVQLKPQHKGLRIMIPGSDLPLPLAWTVYHFGFRAMRTGAYMIHSQTVAGPTNVGQPPRRLEADDRWHWMCPAGVFTDGLPSEQKPAPRCICFESYRQPSSLRGVDELSCQAGTWPISVTTRRSRIRTMAFSAAHHFQTLRHVTARVVTAELPAYRYCSPRTVVGL